MERNITPIQAIEPTDKIRAIRPIQLLYHSHFRAKLKKKLPNAASESQLPIEDSDDLQNKAQQNTEHVGERIDFKI